MKRSIATSFVVVLIAVVMLAGCSRRESATKGDAATETIAPAAPQPAPTGTDAMTQTVDVESGRSEAEGGGLSSPDVTTGTNATTATTATVATPAPPASTTTR